MIDKSDPKKTTEPIVNRWFVLGFVFVALAAVNGGLLMEHGTLLQRIVAWLLVAVSVPVLLKVLR